MAMMKEFKVNLFNSNILKISTKDNKHHARLVLEKDGVHGHYTDVHVSDGETLIQISRLVGEMGIQIGK